MILNKMYVTRRHPAILLTKITHPAAVCLQNWLHIAPSRRIWTKFVNKPIPRHRQQYFIAIIVPAKKTSNLLEPTLIHKSPTS